VPRLLLLLTLLRGAVVATVMVALYYRLPLDGGDALAVAVQLAVGLLVFAAVVAAQAWQIARSDHPRLRAVDALATAIPLFLLVFATAYFAIGRGQPGSFSEALTRTDALYFTITVFSTVGFGDITPVTGPARVVTMFQMLADLAVFGLVARVVVGAVAAGLRRRSAGTPAETARAPALPPPRDEAAGGGPP
jgi:hypothetical protein